MTTPPHPHNCEHLVGAREQLLLHASPLHQNDVTYVPNVMNAIASFAQLRYDAYNLSWIPAILILFGIFHCSDFKNMMGLKAKVVHSPQNAQELIVNILPTN